MKRYAVNPDVTIRLAHQNPWSADEPRFYLGDATGAVVERGGGLVTAKQLTVTPTSRHTAVCAMIDMEPGLECVVDSFDEIDTFLSTGAPPTSLVLNVTGSKCGLFLESGALSIVSEANGICFRFGPDNGLSVCPGFGRSTFNPSPFLLAYDRADK